MPKAKSVVVDRRRRERARRSPSTAVHRRPPASRRRSTRGARRCRRQLARRPGSGRGCGRRSRGPLPSAPAGCGARTRAPALGVQLGGQRGRQGHQQLAVPLRRRAGLLARPAAPRPRRRESSTGWPSSCIVILPVSSSSAAERVAVRRVERLLDLRHPLAEARAGLGEDRPHLVMDVDRCGRRPSGSP